MFRDLLYASRTLFRTPGFTAAALVTLALGIGANTAIFTVVDALLLRPLPYRDPERLALVWERNIPRDRKDNVVSPGNFIHWREQARSFEQLAGGSLTFRVTLLENGEPEELPMQYVTPAFFPILGVQPQVGRWFRPDEEQPGVRLAMLGHDLWVTRFGADPGVVDRMVNLGGEPVRVAGVMPPGFHFLDRSVQLWMALAFRAESRTPRGRWMFVVGRLQPGVSIEQAQVEMDTIHAGLTEQFPDFNTGWATTVVPVQDHLTGAVRRALLMLLGAVGLVLLIACANMANLLLARGTSRRRELAIRAALGAGRGRIARQLLTESVLLGVAGGALGVLLAWWGVGALRAVVATTMPLFPRLDEIAVHPRILGFAATLSVGTGLVFGLAPAFAAWRTDVQAHLREGGRSATGGEGFARGAFVVVQVAMALVLLAGAGLLLRSFMNLLNVAPGFNPERAMTARVSVSGERYEEIARVLAFFNELTERLQTAPGVQAAGGISFLPMSGPAAATRFEIVGAPKPEAGLEPVCEVRVIAGNYFAAMGIPLLAGRGFDQREQTGQARVAVINAAMARQFWPNESPIGKRIIVSWNDEGPDEIVGVVGDVRLESLEADVRPAVYWPQGRFAYPWGTIVVRTEGEPSAAASLIQREVRAIDPTAPVSDFKTLETVLSRSLAQRRLTMVLLGIFAAVALTLAVVGIYGVMAYLVAQRTREMGVRMALGAKPGDVLRLVVGRALLLAAIGVGIGTAAALVLTRFMTALLYGTEPHDPATLAVVAAVMMAAALAASYIPGRAATRVDPLVALRAE